MGITNLANDQTRLGVFVLIAAGIVGVLGSGVMRFIIPP